MKAETRSLRKTHIATLLLALFLGGCSDSTSAPSLANPAPSGGISTATTMDRAIVTTGTGTYKKLTYGPGWARVLRTELAGAQDGRESRRTPLLCVAHFSDVHIIDEESPLRTEFLRNLTGLFLPATEFQAAWRPQETLTTQVTEAMVRKINAIGGGPVSGRPYDCAVFTGDNGDNCHQSELSRFLTLMDGGTLTPKTGNPNLYEGVQDDKTPLLTEYWHPESGISDMYKTTYKFPDFPGLLTAAIQPFQATGLKTPFYTCYGNHDHLIQGNFPIKANTAPANALTTIAQGSQKILALPVYFQHLTGGLGVDFFLAAFLNPLTDTLPGLWGDFISAWTAPTTPARTVTADATRQLLGPTDFVRAHLSDGATPGPVGHGFTQTNLQNGTLYYTFQPSSKVLGITLDTTNPGGLNNGSIDSVQVAWMEQQIQAVSSHYYDANGNLVTTGNADKLVVLCSHHGIDTLTNVLPDLDNPQTRLQGAAIEAILHRYPNVVLWLNGHTHYCRIYGHPDPNRRTGGFWEVNSPSLIDFPQEARIVEMMDNQDGTLSIFGTMVDTAAEPQTGAVTNDTLTLASISRELAANDPQLVNQPLGLEFQLGQLSDRNVELLINRPFTP